MTLGFDRIGWMWAVAGVFTLAACDRHAPASATPPAITELTAPASAPLAGIVPQAEDAAGSGVPGPGSGATAVGGMAASHQDDNGAAHNGGAPPTPTAGDGASGAAR